MNDVTFPNNLPSSADQNILREIPIDRIYIDPNRRSVDAATVSDLEKSLEAVGQINPICVRPIQGNPAHEWVLVAGLHRLEAARNAGLTVILARVLDLDEIKARLVQLDENLIRKIMSTAEKDAAIAERRAIYDLSHDDKAKAAHVANKKMGRRHDASDTLSPAFSESLAARNGVSRRTIERSVARADAIGTDLLKQLAGTSLDKATELEALAQLPEVNKKAISAKAIAGENVSAKRLLNKSTKGSNNTKSAKRRLSEGTNHSPLDRLQTAWDAAKEEERQKFLDRNGLTRKAT